MGTLIALQKDIIWCSQPATPPEPDVPDGKTATPINDVETWLACADLQSTGYTTLQEVLADSSVLLAAIAADNAIDYLVRSTDFATDICANQNAIMGIDSSNYASTTLYADPTWQAALIASPYLSKTFAFTGAIQNFQVTASGIYKLEVWGAAGAHYGGAGGYSYGNVELEAGDTIYVVVGGQNTYNGGGTSTNQSGDSKVVGGAGGGATHIGTENTTLRYTTKAKVYIVAGGGGGGITQSDHDSYSGGSGGGLSGGIGNRGITTSVGTQTSAGTGGGYGYGGSSTSSSYACPGGGGGLYGGSRGAANTDGATGGSGYIGGCISGTASTSNGVRSGNGQAKITFVEFS